MAKPVRAGARRVYPLRAAGLNRDNALNIDGWTVLRYNTRQIRENFQTECMRGIEAGINKLGGLTSDGLVPRVLYMWGNRSTQQLNLFDGGDSGYQVESSPEFKEID